MTTDPADRIIGIYTRHAAAFDRQRPRDLAERAWLDRFLALVPDGAAVLDVGCGMGEPIARHLIEAGRHVTGVDSSSGLLDLCRQRFPAHTWIQADMRQVSRGRRFQGVLAWDSFFHLRAADQRAMFPIFAAHAAPGAALMFTSGPAAGEALGVFEGETLYHASLDPAEYRDLLAANGFTVAGHRPEDPDCGGRTVWLARLVPA